MENRPTNLGSGTGQRIRVTSARGSISNRKLHIPSAYRFDMSRHSYSLAGNLVCPSDKSSTKPKIAFMGDMEHPLSNFLRCPEKSHIGNLKRRVHGKDERCLSYNSFNNSWVQSRELDRFGISNGEFQQSEQDKAHRTCASYQSEAYDINGPNFDSLGSSEGANEIVLGEENVKKLSSSWGPFPKRWVIVLLCFSAFLLCNMDRVNMSIAILPMAAEFNWNSATVGLIQSSFFWGYLLTQIAGGILADKIGGKRVLGFGVVWWSVATILTPIAAKLGLPYLLVMRAFMGIGENLQQLLDMWIHTISTIHLENMKFITKVASKSIIVLLTLPLALLSLVLLLLLAPVRCYTSACGLTTVTDASIIAPIFVVAAATSTASAVTAI